MTEQEIINAAVEKALLLMPEVVGNMIVQHITNMKLNAQFYKDHPDFKDHRSVVQAVIEMIDGKDTLASYDEKLKVAVPEIRRRIELMKSLDMTSVQQAPNRIMKESDFSSRYNGEI